MVPPKIGGVGGRFWGSAVLANMPRPRPPAPNSGGVMVPPKIGGLGGRFWGSAVPANAPRLRPPAPNSGGVAVPPKVGGSGGRYVCFAASLIRSNTEGKSVITSSL